MLRAIVLVVTLAACDSDEAEFEKPDPAEECFYLHESDGELVCSHCPHNAHGYCDDLRKTQECMTLNSCMKDRVELNAR